MLTQELEKQTYTDICVKCEQPHSTLKTRNFVGWLFREVIFVAVLTLLFIPVLFFTVMAAGWIAIPLWLVFFLYRGRQQKRCPSCGSYTLIPVASPRGVDIMQKHGWKPL